MSYMLKVFVFVLIKILTYITASVALALLVVSLVRIEMFGYWIVRFGFSAGIFALLVVLNIIRRAYFPAAGKDYK